MADRLTAGEGSSMIHQASVQQALWWYLPRNCPEGQWREYLDATAELLTELGIERLARIASSEQTAAVLAAWAEDEDRGAAAFKKAEHDSGVDPPDTPLLAWGSFMGVEEARALDEVERALGEALGLSTLAPGSAGWRRRAAAITAQVLSASSELVPGQSRLSLITTERVSMWIDLASPPLREWRKAVGNRLLNPIEPPADPAAAIAPMAWLLDLAAGEGAELTQSGYLPRLAVVDAGARFGWWDWPKPPRSEADVFQIQSLRAAATRLHLVRRRGRRLRLTSRGSELRRDPAELWRVVATESEDSEGFTRMITELVGLRLLGGRIYVATLAADVAPVLRQQGWSSAGGLVTAQEVKRAAWRPLRWWRMFGLLDEEDGWDSETHRRLAPDTIALTPAGEATVLAYLRARATGPRKDFYGSER